jgi:hypothetical protein
MSADQNAGAYRDNYEHLEDELDRLDLLLRLRAMTLRLHNQAHPEAQAQRAVYITSEEVAWLLAPDAPSRPEEAALMELRAELARLGAAIEGRVERSQQAGLFLALPHLGQIFGLSAFELEAVVICLAPELRRKYDRLYAYLQDDITRKRPSVDLVLELLCETEAECWSGRRLFCATAPLLRAGLLEQVDDPHSPSGSSGLAQFLRLDPRVCHYLLGSNPLDARLVDLVRLFRPDGVPNPLAMEPSVPANVLGLVEHYLAPGGTEPHKLVVYLHGPYGAGKRDLALHTCRQLGCSLLSLDVELLMAQGAAAPGLLHLAFREGLLQQAVPYLERAEALFGEAARPLLKALEVAIAEYGWLVFLTSTAPWTLKDAFTGCAFQPVALPVPDVPLRAAAWRRSLDGRVPGAGGWADQLAGQFRLTPGQIRAAVERAENRRVMAPEPRALGLSDLATACRQVSHHKLGELAVKVEPHYGWDDIVLPADKVAHLREIADQVRHQYRVFGAWGFGKKLSHGKGLSALFTGPPGTGKTMAAEVLAHDLELDLYKVDLSGVVSKYVGETEKNLARIFEEAEASNAILFFDEADALFGKRTDISDAHDRYANIETSYLLQKMEAYEGVVILATNLRENMDDAFTRRIRFVVEFPFPDEASRLRIWQTHFPGEAPVSKEIDYGYLARELPVAGGNIKNIVLNSAFLAASDGGVIEMGHVLHGVRREFEKMGKLWLPNHAE